MINTSKNLCFVIGPIGKHKSRERTHADTLLKKIIKPTFARHFRDFMVERADRIARPGMIDSQVITHLIEAELVIADITGRNANAFYELGIRHMLQKPVIHLFRRGSAIPMDIAPYRAIEFDYEDTIDVREAKTALRKTVVEAMLPTFIVENPVTRSAGFMRMQAARQNEPAEENKRARGSRFGRPTSSLHDAPGVSWTKKGDVYTATWTAPAELVRRGYPYKGMRLWAGTKKELTEISKHWITDRANVLQAEMYEWNNIIR